MDQYPTDLLFVSDDGSDWGNDWTNFEDQGADESAGLVQDEMLFFIPQLYV